MNFATQRWLIVALSAIVLGYGLLATRESTVLAPILLVVGYCVLIPGYLWTRFRGDEGERSVGE